MTVSFRTPPLSELDFSVDCSGVEYLPESAKLVNDFYFINQEMKGNLSVEFTQGSGKPLFKTLSDYITVDNKGVFSARSRGRVVVECGGLARAFEVMYDGTGSTEPLGYAENTLGRHINDTYNDLVNGKTPSDTTKNIFLNMDEVAGTAQWNPECWAYPVNLTCMASWRDRQGLNSSDSSNWKWPVTAITPRICVCGHVGTWIGEGYHFFTRDNEIVKRTVIAKELIYDDGGIYGYDPKHDGTSYYVMLLDEDLPSSIVPAKLMPKTALPILNSNKTMNHVNGRYVSSITNLPCIATDQDKRAISNPLAYVSYDTQKHMTNHRYNNNSYDMSFAEEIIGGDSSSPVYWQIGGETVLVTSWYYGLGGSGLYYSMYYDEICQCVYEMCQENNVLPVYPETVDLSNFLKL